MSDFDRTEFNFRFSLSQFKKYPSRFSAYSVYIDALKSNNSIPDNVLRTILPDIEKLYRKALKKTSRHSISKTEHEKKCKEAGDDKYWMLDTNEKLLIFALEEQTIKAACDRFIENEGAAEEDSVRKQLSRILKKKIDSYINSQNSENQKYLLEFFNYTGTDTANMLDIYREILAMESATEE